MTLRHQECGMGKSYSWKAGWGAESHAPDYPCWKCQCHDDSTHSLYLTVPTSLSFETQFQLQETSTFSFTKKECHIKMQSSPFCSASYHMRVWKPHTTCPAWKGRSLPYGRSLFRVMSVLLLVTEFSIYLFKIPTTLSWIPSYFLINKVFHFLKSFCEYTCMFYKLLIIKYFLFTINYFKQLER